MRRVFVVEKVGTPEYQQRLEAEVLADAGNSAPVERILETVAASPYNCVTVVFEKNYIDKDYQDELAVFYCKALKEYPHRCTRLHFFRQIIPYDTKTPMVSFAPFANDYLGFMVLRPTDLQRVGRTYLKPMVQNPDNQFITCATHFTSHMFGYEFQVQPCLLSSKIRKSAHALKLACGWWLDT